MSTQAEHLQRPSALRRQKALWALGALALLVLPLALLWGSMLPGRLFLPQLPVLYAPLAAEHPREAALAAEQINYNTADRILPALTDQREARAQLADGHLPLWEPKLGLGVPLFGASIAGLGYLPNVLGLALPPERAAVWLALVSLLLCALGTYLFLRSRVQSVTLALFGALAHGSSAWVLANLQDNMKVDALLWLPWQLWSIELLARGRRAGLLALALSVALPLYAGFVSIALFSLALSSCYALARLGPWAGTLGLLPRTDAAALAQVARHERISMHQQPGAAPRAPRRALPLAAVGLLAGVLLAAPQWLANAEASAQSLRQAQSVDALEAQSLPLGVLPGLFVPDLFGAPSEAVFAPQLPMAWALTRASQWQLASTAMPLEWNLYGGAGLLLLALAGLGCAGRKALLPGLLLFMCYAFALGAPLVRWLYALPGLDLGAPARVLALCPLLCTWLAVLAVEQLIGGSARAQRLLLALACSAALAAMLALYLLEPANFAEHLRQSLASAHERPLEEVDRLLSIENSVQAAERVRAGLAQLLGVGLGLVALLASLRLVRNLGAALAASVGVLLLVSVPALAGGSQALLLEPWLALGALTLLTLLAGRWSPLGARECTRLLPVVALLAAEMLPFGHQHLAARQSAGLEAFPPSAAIGAIARAAGDGRVLRFDDSPSGVEQVLQLARPNLLEAYGVSDLTPYMVFTPASLVQTFEALDARMRLRSGLARLADQQLLDHPLLDLARVSCILSREPLRHARLESVLETPGFCVYQRTGAAPLASLLSRAERAPLDEAQAIARLLAPDFDPAQQLLLHVGPDELLHSSSAAPRGQVRSERLGPDRLRVEIDDCSGGWLLLHEQWYPGWRASVNGAAATVQRADVMLRAVRVPQGRVELLCWYEPEALRVGAWLALGALLLVLGLCLFQRPLA